MENAKKTNDSKALKCIHEDRTLFKDEVRRPLFNKEPVTGKMLSPKYAKLFYNTMHVTKLFIPVVVHVVSYDGRPSGAVVDREWIGDMFNIANEIWSQACIELTPYYSENYITTFRDISLIAFAGSCIHPDQNELVEPYEITIPNPEKIVNLFLVEDTNGIACGSPITGRVFLPTSSSVTFLARVFAHEIGHILLNPVGVADCANPDHLMFHAHRHPDIPPGTRRGLFLSDCLGARVTAQENIYSFARSTSFSDIITCDMSPQLGSDLFVVGINTEVTYLSK